MPLKRVPRASMVHVWTFSALYDVKNMKLAVKSIFILHVFTGSNAKSVFGNKGKVKPLKIILKTIHYINISANNGVGASLKNYRLNFLQQFLCDLYCHRGDNTWDTDSNPVNKEGWRQKIFLYVSTVWSYMLHVIRINHEMKLSYCKAWVLSILDHGWKMREESISIKWNTVKPSSKEILELMFFTCSKSYVQKLYSCIQKACSAVIHAPN